MVNKWLTSRSRRRGAARFHAPVALMTHFPANPAGRSLPKGPLVLTITPDSDCGCRLPRRSWDRMSRSGLSFSNPGQPSDVRASALSRRLTPQSNNFNALRLGAALAVVVSHAFPLATGSEASEPLAGVNHFTLGQHAVNLFFTLSGLMTAASLDRSPGYGTFALRRILRVLPGLAASIALTALVLGPLVSTLPLRAYLADPGLLTFLARMAALSSTAATLPGVFSANPLPGLVNEPLWTIKYELLCYAVLAGVAALGLLRSRRRCLWLAAASLAAYVALRSFDQFEGQIGHASHVARFWLCFVLGVTAYVLRDHVRPSWPLAAGLAAGLVLAVGSPIELLASYLAVGYGAVCLALLPAGALRRATNRADLSYGVYIYGWPLTQAVLWARPGLTAWELLTLALPLSLAAAWVSWRFIERPALSLKDRCARSPEDAPPAPFPADMASCEDRPESALERRLPPRAA